IVFGEDRDGGARFIGSVRCAGLGAKGGLQAAHSAFDFDADLAERASQQSGCEVLLEFQLRMGMDLAAEAGCLVLEAIDRVADIIVDSYRGLLGSWNWREKAPHAITRGHATRAHVAAVSGDYA